MRGQKFLSILMIMCLALTVFVHPLLIYAHDDSGDTDVTHSESGHTGGGKGEKGGGNSGGGHGKGGKGGGHSEVVGTEEEDEGGSDNSEDHKGGISRGGQGKGGSGAKKGNPKKDSAGGTITLNVTVLWEDEEGNSVDNTQGEVDVTLTRYVDDVAYPTTVSTKNGVATFTSEASGDCDITGEAVPGFETPLKEISLTGDNKVVEEKLVYVQGNFLVEGVTLNKDKIKLISGYTEQLTAEIIPAKANNQSITWSSDEPTVASVDNGLVTGKSSGDATITVETVDGGFSASCEVTVVSIESLVPISIQAIRNQVILLPKTVESVLSDETTAQLPVVWKLDDEELASIFKVPTDVSEYPKQSEESQNRVITLSGIVNGTDKKATFEIIVIPGIATPVTGVELNENQISLYVYPTESTSVDEEYPNEFQLEATLLTNPAREATTQDVIWTSSETSVATVDDNGLVKAVSTGKARITVKTIDGEYEAYCLVSVTLAPEISLIYPTLEDGVFAEHFETRNEIYINIENLIAVKGINEPTRYYVKVEEKSNNPLLGDGEIFINPEDTEFNLFNVTGFDLTSNYSNEYFVSMSTSDKYPKNDELTLKTNFKIGTAVPTIPENEVDVTLDITGGYRENDPEEIIFLLCREIDVDKALEDITWQDYLSDNLSEKLQGLKNSEADPYNYLKVNYDAKDPYEDIKSAFSDEVKMIGLTKKIVPDDGTDDEDIIYVQWLKPREALKLGGYFLIEVTPKGYIDNLGLVNPYGDGTLLKEVHLTRDGSILREVENIYIGNKTGN